MMYNKIEVAIILKSCNSVSEVMEVGKAFGFLKWQLHEVIPEWVNKYCHQRLRTIQS